MKRVIKKFVVVRHNNMPIDTLWIDNTKGIARSKISSVVGRVPNKDYVVEYRLNRRGRYLVIHDTLKDAFIQRGMDKAQACLLNRARWDGKRVSRRVIA